MNFKKILFIIGTIIASILVIIFFGIDGFIYLFIGIIALGTLGAIATGVAYGISKKISDKKDLENSKVNESKDAEEEDDAS